MKSFLIAALLLTFPALSKADESKAESKVGSDGSSSSKTKTEKTAADGSKVKKETAHDRKADGTGEAKSETTTKDPVTGAESKSKKKTTKTKRQLRGTVMVHSTNMAAVRAMLPYA